VSQLKIFRKKFSQNSNIKMFVKPQIFLSKHKNVWQNPKIEIEIFGQKATFLGFDQYLKI